MFSAGGDGGFLLIVSSGENSLLASWVLYDIIKDITTQKIVLKDNCVKPDW